MKVEEILRKKKEPRIITIRMNETVEVAIRLLRRENIGALIVKDVVRTEGNTVVGMFSERDVVRALADRGPAALKMRVADLMSRTIVSCSPQDELSRVLELMERHHIRHLPVLDGIAPVGVVSVRDILSERAGMDPHPVGLVA